MPFPIKTRQCEYCNKSFQGIHNQNHCTLVCRFWSKIKIKAPNKCWEWKGTKSHGYAIIRVNRHNVKAARLAYKIKHGEVPVNMFILHKCDNPGCVNPNHLFPGTQADNNKDMAQKNRCNPLKGEDNPLSKLTEKDVIKIRAKLNQGFTHRQIAKEFSVSYFLIGSIKRKKAWKHL